MSTTYTLIRLTLDIRQRWGVGVPTHAEDKINLRVSSDPTTDDGHGELPHVPGSSLAGSLRRHLGPNQAARWLGDAPTAWEEVTGDKPRTPSKLGFLGVIPGAAKIETRGSTTIDGPRGAATGRLLRFEQWAEPGSVTVAFEHPGPADAELMDALASWTPIIGRSRSTGMGGAAVDGVDYVTIDLAKQSHLTWWMNGRQRWYSGGATIPPGAAASEKSLADDERPTPTGWSLPLRWRVMEPLHVGVGDVEESADRFKTLTTMRLTGRAVVPGSTWKGIFRHRVVAILGALGCVTAAADDVVGVLFGSKDAAGLLRFSDSVAPEGSPVVVRTHVAIDRFTGGARDGALFRVEALDEGAEFDLLVTSSGRMPPEVEVLIKHVVRDVHDGLVGVGGMGTRGYGSLALIEPALLDGLPGVDLAKLVVAVATLNRRPATTSGGGPR